MCEIGINELKLNIYDIKLSQNTVINAFFYFIASHLYGLRPHHLSYNSPGIGNVGTINGNCKLSDSFARTPSWQYSQQKYFQPKTLRFVARNL